MLSYFFKKDLQSERYFRLGGPRSFHKFTYKNTQLILIGEFHNRMSFDLSYQYLSVFNQFIIENNHVTLFLESTHDEIESFSPEGIGFISSMKQLTPSPHLEVIHADKRADFCHEKFIHLWCFLDTLIDMEKKIMSPPKRRIIQLINATKFFQSEDIINKAIKVETLYQKSCHSKDLGDYLASQIKILNALAEKFLEVDEQVHHFIIACLLDLNDALGSLIKLEDEYLSMGFQEEDLETRNLATVCVDMMKKKENFKPVYELHDIYIKYLRSFNDATLLCDIWNKLQCHDYDKQTLIVIMGDSHIERLLTILKLISVQEVSILADRKGDVISPTTLDEYLKKNFEPAPKKESLCLLM